MKEDGVDELSKDISSTIGDLVDSFSIQNGQPVSGTDTKFIFIILIIIAVVMIALAAIMIVQLVINAKSQKLQNEHFNKTLNLIKNIHQESGKIRRPDDVPRLEGSQEMTFEELQELAKKCQALGEKIDAHTNRQNNSKSVSELVFKVSTALGLEKHISTLYFCAAMVYDAGFLDLPQDLFFTEILSAAERKLMRTHVMRYSSQLDFIPFKFYSIFAEAASLHHENMNGTGYPEGLKGSEIPTLPRIIHAVESYVSLVNRRSYHKMLNKKDAIAELRRQPGIYDMDIIDILEKII